MSSLGAFARTSAARAGALRPLAADKIKWWAKKKANDGEVSLLSQCGVLGFHLAGFFCMLLMLQQIIMPQIILFCRSYWTSVTHIRAFYFYDLLLYLQITRHMSPHEIHPVGPWLKTWPKKV